MRYSRSFYGGMAGLSLSCFAVFKLWNIFRRRRNKDVEIASLHDSLSAALANADAKEGMMKELTKELERVRREMEVVQRLLQSLRSENQSLGEQVAQKGEEAEHLKDESRHIKEKYEQTLSLLDSRTKELRSAEVFLTKADSLSGADIISMLNSLNSEIYQTAALVAESYDFLPKTEISEPDQDMTRMETDLRITHIIGSRMVELLKSTHHHEDPTLLQIAFQVGMAAYSNKMISAWDFDDPAGERLLGWTYRRLRSQEEQTISGRWRALTRAYVRQTDSGRASTCFVDALVNILITAGAHEKRKELQDLVTSRYSQRINLIVKNVQAVRKAIGEDITSCDFTLLFVEQDKPYDPSQMEDSFGQGILPDSKNPVLCTTDLGLSRSAKMPGKVDEYQQTVMLRPKIVLRSGMDEMLAQDLT